MKVKTMQWTNEKPTAPGWYWHRSLDFYDKPRTEVVRVVFDDEVGPYVVSALWVPEEALETADGEWAGPIPEPTDPA